MPIVSFTEEQINYRKGAEIFLSTLEESITHLSWSLEHNINTDNLLSKKPSQLLVDAI